MLKICWHLWMVCRARSKIYLPAWAAELDGLMTTSWVANAGRPQTSPACRCAAPATAATSAESFLPQLHGWRLQHAATLCASCSYDIRLLIAPAAGPQCPAAVGAAERRRVCSRCRQVGPYCLPQPGGRVVSSEQPHLVGAVRQDNSCTLLPGHDCPLPPSHTYARLKPCCPTRRVPGRPRHKVLLGLNFYGQEFVWKGKLLQKAEPVLASRLLEVLRSYGGDGTGDNGSGSASGSKGDAPGQCGGSGGDTGSCSAAQRSGSGTLRIEWLPDAHEHLFRWRDAAGGNSASGSSSGGSSGGGKKRKGIAHRLYFPTPLALAERLAAAEARGMGAAVWELGQGLDVFCGLL